jgi:serine/threonine-protein kinase
MLERRRVLVMRCSSALVLVSAWAAWSSHARAEGASNKAAAEALFDEARKLMAEQQYVAACPKLEASQALDPGVGTLLNLADCYEKLGKTASAWAQFRETVSAAHKAGSSERERVARMRVQELEPKLSYLTIDTWRGQEIKVSRDGVAIDAAVLGTAIPVDPGVHVIEASASGKRSWSTRVNVGALADRVSVSVPILPNESQEPSPSVAHELSAPPPSAAAASQAPPITNQTPNAAGSLQRMLAIAVAAVGVAGVATGTVFGIKAASNWSDAKAHCDPYPYCGEAGRKLGKAAAQSGTISTLAFVLGGVGLASGAVLWFTAPAPAGEAQATLDLGPGTVTLHGSF